MREVDDSPNRCPRCQKVQRWNSEICRKCRDEMAMAAIKADLKRRIDDE